MVLRLSTKQIEALEVRAANQWDRLTAHELEDLYERYFRCLGANIEHIAHFCRIVRDYASSYQIYERRDVFKMVVVALALGAHFPHDPRYRDMVSRSLGDVSVPSGRRLSLFGREVEALLYKRRLVGNLAWFGARLVGLLKSGGAAVSDADIAVALQGIPHAKFEIYDASLPAFVGACLSQCDAYGVRVPERRVAYCACAVAHGVYWFDDPLLHRLRDCVLTGSLMDDDAADLRAFYEAFA